jgi:hypothetical protein
MKNLILDCVKGFLFTMGVSLPFILSTLMLNYYVVSSNKVNVYVNNKLVYSGRSACVTVDTAGSSSILTISNKTLWCSWSVKDTYVSQNISISPDIGAES